MLTEREPTNDERIHIEDAQAHWLPNMCRVRIEYTTNNHARRRHEHSQTPEVKRTAQLDMDDTPS